MKKIQVTLTVEESKELIALAILEHPVFKKSMEKGKVIFKGGTTVSRISEKFGESLRICGRNSKRGTVAGLLDCKGAHVLSYNKGDFKNIDNDIIDEFSKLTPDDTVVTSVNGIDIFGNAVMMAGSVGGGNFGKASIYLHTTGVNVLIPVGLEKLVPNNLNDAIKVCSRGGKDSSVGMSVGLMPIIGDIITEVESFELLAKVKCEVVGAGGINGGEGSYTFVIYGEDTEVDKIYEIVKELKNSQLVVAGDKDSLVECEAPCISCGRHVSCGYKKRELIEERKKKIGIITIGQSPRVDLTADIEGILGDKAIIKEVGVLDNYTYDEVLEKFKPNDDSALLVSRLRDGTQVNLNEEVIISELQTIINDIEKEVDVVLLLCTGKFPEFKCNKPLIIPQKLLHSTVSNLIGNEKVGVMIPDINQKQQIIKWWADSGIDIEPIVASPYGDFKNIEKSAEKFKDVDVNIVVLDCMGYSMAMKKAVNRISNKLIVLPRTLIARTIEELID